MMEKLLMVTQLKNGGSISEPYVYRYLGVNPDNGNCCLKIQMVIQQSLR
jgi:hypothetical protein